MSEISFNLGHRTSVIIIHKKLFYLILGLSTHLLAPDHTYCHIDIIWIILSSPNRSNFYVLGIQSSNNSKGDPPAVVYSVAHELNRTVMSDQFRVITTSTDFIDHLIVIWGIEGTFCLTVIPIHFHLLGMS